MPNMETTSAELYRLERAEEQQWAEGAQQTPTELLREQRERGFATLWFRPELEADFCRYLRLSGRLSRLTLLSIAFLAMAITPLIDTTLLGMPEPLVPLSRWLQLGGMIPLLLGVGLFCWKRPDAAAIELVMVLLFLGFIAGLLGQRIVDARYGFDLPVEFIGICTVTMFALARIRFFRLAYGAATTRQIIGRNEVVSILDAVSRSGRLRLDWEVTEDLTRDRAKLALLLIACLEAALPYGGSITVDGSVDALRLRGHGPRLRIEADAWNRLRGLEVTSDARPGEVQFAAAAALLRARARPVSIETGEHGGKGSEAY